MCAVDAHNSNTPIERLSTEISYEIVESMSSMSEPPRIAEYRIAKGWTQAQLGERIGMTQGDVSNWERGAHRPSGLRVAVSIAAALEVSVETLWPDLLPSQPVTRRSRTRATPRPKP